MVQAGDYGSGPWERLEDGESRANGEIEAGRGGVE